MAGRIYVESMDNTSWVNVVPASTATVVDLSEGTNTIAQGPSRLIAGYVNDVLSAHSVSIEDGETRLFTLPALLAAGQKIDFHGAKFADNITITPDPAATGEITFLWVAAP